MNDPMSKLKTPAPDAGKSQFDLHERTACFGEQVIAFAKSLPQDRVMAPLIPQLVRAGTSVGANYCEADDAVSRKEFFHKIGTCKKEAALCRKKTSE
jgi:four helix bundle protein